MSNPEKINPYTPPDTSSVGAGDTANTQVAYEEYERQIVQTMGKGMKVVAILQFIAAGTLLALIGALAMVVKRENLSDAGTLVYAVAGTPLTLFVIYLLLVGLGAVWLKLSSSSFSASAAQGSLHKLALGFRWLRFYLLLHGAFVAISLSVTLYKLTGGGE